MLPTDLRRVIALRFYTGMDSTQIGAILDLPATMVRTRLRRALELLRETLADGDSTVAAQALHKTIVSNSVWEIAAG
jgi:DNA-directed RNA polymerase specialized sigma24 family protein